VLLICFSLLHVYGAYLLTYLEHLFKRLPPSLYVQMILQVRFYCSEFVVSGRTDCLTVSLSRRKNNWTANLLLPFFFRRTPRYFVFYYVYNCVLCTEMGREVKPTDADSEQLSNVSKPSFDISRNGTQFESAFHITAWIYTGKCILFICVLFMRVKITWTLLRVICLSHVVIFTLVC